MASLIVNVKATGTGTVTYAVEEYGIDDGATNRLVSYQDVAITTGDILTGTIEDLDTVETANYPLYHNNENTPLKPTINQQYGRPIVPTLPGGSNQNVYNIVVSWKHQYGYTDDNPGFGHVTFIHAIIGGTVYYSESYTSGGKAEGTPLSCSLTSFYKNYNSMYGSAIGAIHFTK